MFPPASACSVIIAVWRIIQTTERRARAAVLSWFGEAARGRRGTARFPLWQEPGTGKGSVDLPKRRGRGTGALDDTAGRSAQPAQPNPPTAKGPRDK